MALAYKAIETYSTSVSTAEVYTRDGDLYKGIPGEKIIVRLPTNRDQTNL